MEASKQPRIEVITEKMVVVPQSVVSTLAPVVRHLYAEPVRSQIPSHTSGET